MNHVTFPLFRPVEVIIIVVAMLLLALILYPIVGNMRAKKQSRVCMGNLMQITQALLTDVQDHGGLFPGHLADPEDTAWYQAAAMRLNLPQLPTCPSSFRAGSIDQPAYGMNGFLTGQNLSKINNASATLLLADGKTNQLLSGDDVDATRHHGGYLASFIDGHLETVPQDDRAMIWGDGDEGVLFAFGATGARITYKGSMLVEGESKTVNEGDAVVLYNDSAMAIKPFIKVTGGMQPAEIGKIRELATMTIAPKHSRVFNLYCMWSTTVPNSAVAPPASSQPPASLDPASPAPAFSIRPPAYVTRQTVETTYQFGDQQDPVIITVRKGTIPSPGTQLRHTQHIPPQSNNAPGPDAPTDSTWP